MFILQMKALKNRVYLLKKKKPDTRKITIPCNKKACTESDTEPSAVFLAQLWFRLVKISFGTVIKNIYTKKTVPE